MSHQLDLSGCKKRKRGERVTFKFASFGERGYPAEFNGSFQENVRALLGSGQLESGGGGGAMAIWSFQLELRRHPLLHNMILFVIEESIQELSPELHCKHCKYIGWGNHMICKKKYHFLVRSNCKSSNNVSIELMLGDHSYDHSMHGVFHSNGFGHLLCINGLENGSELPGYQIMEFWDRLCSGLGARKVSLKDVAKKKGMDLRLLHTAAYGKPWFGLYDYTFGRGSFGVDQQMYQTAVKAIQTIPLTFLTLISPHHIHEHLDYKINEIQIIVSRYQVLSGHTLTTLGDLFNFMLQLKLRLVRERSIKEYCHYPGIMSDASCRWSPKRVEMAIHVVVQALKRAEFGWVSRQHVRDVSRAYIGDTGLLDFVLKSLGNHIVGKYFVRRCLNPVTKVLEYCLEDISRALPKQPEDFQGKLKHNTLHHNISWPQIIKDIFYMCKIIHVDQAATNIGVFDTINVASRIILDTKYFVKEYRGDIECNDDQMNKQKIYCAVLIGDQEGQEKVATPYHCFVLKNNATFDELKCEIEKTFRETYWGLNNFTAATTNNMNFSGSDLVFKTIKPGSKIVFNQLVDGREISNEGLLREMSNFIVDCICGTKDDDGERMVCCDICQVWQHTRCVQISDNDETPNIFLCTACEQEMLNFPNLL